MHKIGHELEESRGVEIPLLTVIAATRNRPADLGAALDTVKAQTFRGYELRHRLCRDASDEGGHHAGRTHARGGVP
jgi:hypothetical protein